MKLVKALLPMLLIIMIRLVIDYSFITHHDFSNYLLRDLLFVNIPFIVILVVGFLYFSRYRALKISFIILSVIMLLNMMLNYGSLLMNEYFNIQIGVTLMFEEFSLLFYLIFIGIAFIVSIRSKNIIAILFASVSILLVLYIDLLYIPNLAYNPYIEFRILLSNGYYKSIVRSTVSVVLISLPVFTSFYAFLKTYKQ